MKILLTAHINGEEREALGDTRDTLLELLRDRLGLTGTKEGCGNGNCGSCTVLMDGVPVNACLVLAQEAAGSRITTIEGLGSGSCIPSSRPSSSTAVRSAASARPASC
jgi:aerobic carbon-monoxide dehydrogenase small subunit